MPQNYPYEIKETEFRCSPQQEYCLEAELAISTPESGYKYDRASTLKFRVDQMSGYPMHIAIRRTDSPDWQVINGIGEIVIEFSGDYEASTLVDFFMHTGQMMKPVYGQYFQGDEDAVCEQTPPV